VTSTPGIAAWAWTFVVDYAGVGCCVGVGAQLLLGVINKCYDEECV